VGLDKGNVSTLNLKPLLSGNVATNSPNGESEQAVVFFFFFFFFLCFGCVMFHLKGTFFAYGLVCRGHCAPLFL